MDDSYEDGQHPHEPEAHAAGEPNLLDGLLGLFGAPAEHEPEYVSQHADPHHGTHPTDDHGHPHDAVADHTHHAAADLGHDQHADYVGVLTAGDPQGDRSHWHYQEPFGENSCAVASQTCILEEIFGHPFPEAEMAHLAEQIGHYDPHSGTPIQAMGNILEYFGVPVTHSDNTSFDRVFDALAHGEKVIVAVNANEIWHPKVDAEGHVVSQPVAGHAVWLTGLQRDDDGHWYAILNDTGTPNGAGERVPYEQFVHAWGEFGYHAEITNLHGT